MGVGHAPCGLFPGDGHRACPLHGHPNAPPPFHYGAPPAPQLEGRDVKSMWGAPQTESDIRDVFVSYINGTVPMVGTPP